MYSCLRKSEMSRGLYAGKVVDCTWRDDGFLRRYGCEVIRFADEEDYILRQQCNIIVALSWFG